MSVVLLYMDIQNKKKQERVTRLYVKALCQISYRPIFVLK